MTFDGSVWSLRQAIYQFEKKRDEKNIFYEKDESLENKYTLIQKFRQSAEKFNWNVVS